MNIQISNDELINLVKESFSKSEILRKIGLKQNSNNSKKLQEKIIDLNLNILHFRKNGSKPIYNRIEKICPICNKSFETLEKHKKEKTVCSHSCSNTYFRSGEKNPNWKDPIKNKNSYRSTCFIYYEKKCVICEWNYSIDVHHIDYNHKNNYYKNLIPLCQNHHKLTTMSKHKDKINEQISNIVENKFK